MLRSESQPTSPEPVANGLTQPTFRDLLLCMRDWLDVQRDEATASKLMRALVSESITLSANSKGGQPPEFDAQELTEACDMPEQEDYEASATKVKNANLTRYLESRRSSVEAFFEGRGFRNALRLKKLSPGGRHRARWLLEVYSIENNDDAAEGQPDDQLVEVLSGTDKQQIKYVYAEAGLVKCSFIAKPLLGKGSFKIKSVRGLAFGGTILLPALCVLSLAGVGWLHLFVHRPLATSDLAFAVLAILISWVLAKAIRDGWWLLSDRIAPASELLVSWKEAPAQLESFRAGDERVIGLVRYTATCPECSAAVELRYGEGQERRRLFGCCVESPQEHVFTFDRVTRRGRRIR